MTKDEAIKIISRLPDDVTLTEIMRQLYMADNDGNEAAYRNQAEDHYEDMFTYDEISSMHM